MDWKPFSTAPTDGTKIEAWHKLWNCVVSIYHPREPLAANFPWIEVTKTTQWPAEAFTHWRPKSESPAIGRLAGIDVIIAEAMKPNAVEVYQGGQLRGRIENVATGANDDEIS